MSIQSISAASPTTFAQQPQAASNVTQPTATQASTVQPSAAGQTNPVPEQGARTHHHHHRGGGGAPAQDSALTQSETTSAAGTSLLNTVV